MRPVKLSLVVRQPRLMVAIEIAKAAGLRRVIKLPVSAPFHCDLMAPAAIVMEEGSLPPPLLMRPFQFIAMSRLPQRQTLQNCEKILWTQVTARVRWRESLIAMSNAGAKKFVELGTGKVLSGLVKRALRPKQLSIWMARMIWTAS